MGAPRTWARRAALCCALLCAPWLPLGWAGECKQLEPCERCIEGDASRNITGCVWMHCGVLEEPGPGDCIGKGEATKETCSIYNVTATCPARRSPTKEPQRAPTKEPQRAPTKEPQRAPTKEPQRAPTKEPQRAPTKEPEILTPGTTAGPPLTATPEFRPPGFNSASFVGGIVLVLSIQAVFYFIVKFLKSKDSTYQTLI
ncbi:CD164 sialomucin-like 2 protein isoform X2 [Chelonia mydas]|uniref:CD164 sialomucin-like 2 protein isoform X2 n=1 Tax=Chelonia mydas TaxID=8469 RepID=UPI0018A1BC6D|nr:CD164 sialomucin-like 2 protein isoform X2 [Chelonia mydas]